MKNNIFIILCITSFLVVELRAQDPIVQYDGIPLIIYPERDAQFITGQNFLQMKDMGVFGVLGGNVLPDFLDEFEAEGLKVLPWYSSDSLYNYIYKYTDAHYTVWEAEGTNPTNGKVTLYHSEHTSISPDGKSVKAEGSNVPDGDTIILGPGYPQNGTYRLGGEFVKYFAEYNMKIEQRDPELPQDYLDDVVCTIIVTNLADDSVLTEATVISKEVTVSEFNGWNNWEGIQISDTGYTLQGHTFNFLQTPGGIQSYQRAHCIQFKVIWSGLNYLNLYIDKIRVYDDKGWQLMNLSQPGTQITTLVNTYITDPTIIGWYGVDEPPSIDNYEPFRVVDGIIDLVSNGNLRLHTGFTGGYPGTYTTWVVRDTFAFNKYQDVEFWFRAKPKNLQMNLYNYHYPFPSTPGLPGYIQEWQTENIKYVTETLDRVNDLDSGFAFSTQSGKFSSSVPGESILPSPQQIIYHVNLGLMYGAKELRLDPFFSNATGNIGLIDQNDNTTANYNFFKHTLIPRLNSKFGKTLRGIHQTEQYTNINPSVAGDLNLNHIKKIRLDYGENPAYPSWIDLGFFNKQSEPEASYFMIVNRYYSDELLNEFIIDFRNLQNYTNWNLRNYIDTSEVTILHQNGIGESPMQTINSGDGILYSISPVVLYGGTLLADEPAGEGQILQGDMIIDNSATLTISGTYYANANIIIKNGKILNGSNGKIVFAEGKVLIIEGSAIINGTTEEKLVLDFASPNNSNGIIIKADGTLNLSYCQVKNAINGVKADVNFHYLNLQNTDFTGCDTSSVSIFGQQGDGESTPPPSQIKYCTMYGSQYGISALNIPEITIQQNDIRNTKTGIFLSQVPRSYVINNTIINYSLPSVLWGILMTSSGGDIRKNTITNHYEGLRIGNSASLNIGGNEIYDNKYHGIFIDVGSNPYMVGRLIYDITFHGWYAISGYNDIRDNGGYFEPYGPPYNDGSEIYLNTANVQMRDGCNAIVDNRVPESDPLPGDLAYTQLLMNGTLSGGILLNVENNFWDEHSLYPLSTRFGNLIVDYIPYKTEPCEIPFEGGEDMLVARTSTGEVIDTLYPVSEETGELSGLEILYASSEKLFITGEIESSESYYDEIISSDTTLSGKLEAYNRKYEIGKLLGRNEEYFSGLRNTYTSLSNSTSDSLLKKIFNQLSTLCLSAKQEYIPAINIFDEIIQQNQGTEIAAYAEIDAITTSLLVEGNDSTLQKGALRKYLIKSGNDYFSKLDGILRKHFGVNEEETKEEILPTEYTLYQNYPNPFNPTTTIKYDLPTTSEVSLSIYDVLGRKVKTLVNQNQQAWRYEISFNATGLASGVYIYQLRTKDFVSTKKMILLR